MYVYTQECACAISKVNICMCVSKFVRPATFIRKVVMRLFG